MRFDPESLPTGSFELVYEVPGRYVDDHCIARLSDSLLQLDYIHGIVGMRCCNLGLQQSGKQDDHRPRH